ncbi:hypothetical protein [Luteimonas abyssi]|uniref:hypothetical protein n=1 Tax=Luteimonas abyssi TaxID=1247514 RepID=UPI0012FB6B3A|nr:hypothetical protein [Luteimonas abyssi]
MHTPIGLVLKKAFALARISSAAAFFVCLACTPTLAGHDVGTATERPERAVLVFACHAPSQGRCTEAYLVADAENTDLEKDRRALDIDVASMNCPQGEHPVADCPSENRAGTCDLGDHGSAFARLHLYRSMPDVEGALRDCRGGAHRRTR